MTTGFYLQVDHLALERSAQVALSSATPGTLVEAAMPTYNEVRRKVQQVAIATNLVRLLFFVPAPKKLHAV